MSFPHYKVSLSAYRVPGLPSGNPQKVKASADHANQLGLCVSVSNGERIWWPISSCPSSLPTSLHTGPRV